MPTTVKRKAACIIERFQFYEQQLAENQFVSHAKNKNWNGCAPKVSGNLITLHHYLREVILPLAMGTEIVGNEEEVKILKI